MFYFWTLSVKHHFPVSLTQNQWRQEFSLRSTVIGCTENSCHGQLLSSSLMYDSKWSSSRAQYMLWEIWGLWSLGEYSKRVIHDNCINHPHITHPRTNEWKPNGKSIDKFILTPEVWLHPRFFPLLYCVFPEANIHLNALSCQVCLGMKSHSHLTAFKRRLFFFFLASPEMPHSTFLYALTEWAFKQVSSWDGSRALKQANIRKWTRHI